MKKLLMLPLFLLLGACASPGGTHVETRVIDTACDWVPTGSFSRKDTKDTKEWMLEYEKARRVNCPAEE